MFKSKTKKFILGILLCLCAALFALLSAVATQKAYAYTTANMPTGTNAIGNLVSSIDDEGNVKFDKANLKSLAQKGGYDSLDKMVKAAEGGAIKNSKVFGETIVYFGKNATNNSELAWIPVYLSQADREGSDKKDAILTLLLATSSEKSYFTDGTYTQNKDTTPSSNNYSTSMIRVKALNNGGKYCGNYNNSSTKSYPSSITYTATSNGSNIFEMYTTGALKDYIVAPNSVSWQKTANKTKNDPEWAGNANGHYTSTDWLNDKLWLPSIYEMYASTIKANCVDTVFTNDGGMWGMSNDQLRTSNDCWLRSGYPTNYHNSYILNASLNCKSQIFTTSSGVRPALHLNLSMLSVCEHKLTAHPKATYCDKEGHEAYWECSLCDGLFSDSAAQKPIDEIVKINAAGHDYSDDWSSNDTKHWHVCANNCGIKGSEEDHTWDSGTVTEQPSCTKTGKKLLTCTTCQKTKTEDIPKSEHTYSSEWKYDATNHWHECSVCNAVQPNSTVAHSGGSSDCQNKKQCSICSQAYGDYGAHTPETIRGEDPDCTTKGKTEGSKCSVCQEILTAQSEINALGHDFSITVSGTQPTCQHGGTATMKCSRCEETQVQNSADPVDHVYTNYVSNGNATCTQNGTKTAACDFGCGTENTIVDEGSATGHTPGEEATCTTPQTCIICNTELSAALGHNWKTDWETDTTNHWHECTVCYEKKDDEAHSYDWVITKQPTEEEEGEKDEYCTVCDYANGNKETIAKLVSDDNGNVSDLPVLPPNQDYDLEIAVKESDSLYNIAGITKGYKVELFVVDGENRTEYDNSKKVTLMLVIPEGMEDEFTLYCRYGEILERVDPATYTVNGKSVTIRTTLPNEYVFNAPAPEPEEPTSGIPWWVWVIVGTGVAVIIILIIVIALVAKNKKNGDGTPVVADNGEVLSQLAEQGQKIDELLTRGDDGGFNTPVELDENGNVIFK